MSWLRLEKAVSIVVWLRARMRPDKVAVAPIKAVKTMTSLPGRRI